ncbi:hypothetical protein FPZ24_09300 [Sphingomonas panacisoli]|uniref:DUF3224 domain-containing protein n=1 Tax=Sphingomonas panacisoli TaxID=1813879 RepID=A0A5B8LJ93_9SPHN|nr:hypothetical protein [Sphingomonas panacisoli]QDZ07662.1 hypothetical protein FPZ24_09300 [Sphingomonas panacisoli]
MTDRRNVTGVWYGRWSSPNPYVAPNSFIATLQERASRVSGSVTEADRQDGTILRSTIDGARAGGRIQFMKQYDGGRLSHTVAYAGTINGAGTEILGTFQFSRYAGDFVMTRETFSADELSEEQATDREVELTPR